MDTNETLKKRCRELYQGILAEVEKHSIIGRYSNEFSTILTESIQKFEKKIQDCLKSNQRLSTNKLIDDRGNGDEIIEPQIVNGVTSSNDLSSPEEMKSVEPKELTKDLHELDEDVRKAVSNIFNDTVNGQAESQHDLSDDDELSVIDVESEDNVNDGNTLNMEGATFNVQSNENQLIKSEVVTQRTQHLMIQAVEGGIFQMGIREEVVTTTTVTESRSETNEPDSVTPMKRKTRDSQQTTQLLESEKNSTQMEQPIDDKSNKRKFSTEQMAETISQPIQPPIKRRYSMNGRGFHSGVDGSYAKPTSSTQTPKYEQAMKKRRSNLRKTIASRSDLENVVENDIKVEMKNIDKKMYAKNNLYGTLCMLCDGKGKFMVRHYVDKHPEYEVLIARPSPKSSDRLRLQNDCFEVSGIKISGFCYFCEANRNMTKSNWMEHLLTHTGELLYTCTECHTNAKRMNDHKICGNTMVNIYNGNADDGSLMAFICNKCNYLQIGRERMVTHLLKQHGVTERTGCTEGHEFNKVMLVPSPNPATSPIATEYQFVHPAKRFSCTICSTKSNNVEDFEEHFDMKHNQVNQYNCFCGEKIMMVDNGQHLPIIGSYISAHLCRHNADLYQCKVHQCDYVFTIEKEVQDHLLYDHPDSKIQYQHVRRAPNQSTVITEVTIKKFKCNICQTELKDGTFRSALLHSFNAEDHPPNEVNVSGHLSKKVTYSARKVSDTVTQYLNGDQLIIKFKSR